MLTEKEKQVLHKAFEKENLEVLSLTAAEKISAAVSLSIKKIEWFALERQVLPARYQRNIGSLGIKGQKKLLESSCLVVGLGGLGSFVCEQLARLGAGIINVVDFDTFEQTNLNRQLDSNLENLGGKKTIETKKRIEKINRAVDLFGFDCKFSELPEKVWQEADIIFDCLDNIEDRLTLAHKCSELNKPLIHGAVAGWYGEVGVIWPDSDTLDKIYKDQTKGMEKKLGTPVYTVAVTAGIMAAEGVKVLIGKYKKKENKLHCFDLLENCFQTIKF